MSLERDVARGVHRLAGAFVNCYLVEDDDGVLVVDAGVPGMWDDLLSALSAIGRSREDVRAVALTHAHFDHVGFAEKARTELGVPVLCHPDEIYLTRHPWRYKQERLPVLYLWRPDVALRFARFAAGGALWTPKVQEVGTFAVGDKLSLPGRPQVVATPGHTFGHVAFHLPDRDVVIAGDALVTLDPYTGRTGPRLVARAATADSDQAFASLRAIAATRAKIVLGGHGDPWTDGAQHAAELARSAGSA